MSDVIAEAKTLAGKFKIAIGYKNFDPGIFANGAFISFQTIAHDFQMAVDWLGDVASAVGQAATWVWNQIQGLFNDESSVRGDTAAQQAIAQDTDNGANTSTNPGGYYAIGSPGLSGYGGYGVGGGWGYGGYGEAGYDAVKTKKTASAASVNRASVGAATARGQLAALHLSQTTATATHPGSYSSTPVAHQAEPEIHLAAHH